jgi:hypothetical protein
MMIFRQRLCAVRRLSPLVPLVTWALGCDATNGTFRGDAGVPAEGGQSSGGVTGTSGTNSLLGGEPNTGLTSSTGGTAPSGGTVSTGGASSTDPASCDFLSTACGQNICTSTSVPTWAASHCQSLLTCLQINSACITASDPLCSTKGSYGVPVCADYYDFSNDPTTISAIAGYVACICGLT